MSTRTDFFVATSGEVLTMQFPPPLTGGPKVHIYKTGPDGKSPTLEPLFPDRPFVASKNISPDNVADLDFVVTANRDREPQWIGPDENTGAYRLDGELVQAIAEIRDDQLEEIADEWGISDVAGTVSLLKQLRALCQAAQSHDEEVFLYLHV